MKTKRPREQEKFRLYLKSIATSAKAGTKVDSYCTIFNFKHMGDFLLAFSDNPELGQEDSVYLLLISVEDAARGSGTGTHLMNLLITAADIYNVKLSLTVMQVEEQMSEARLKKFYRRFGFVVTEGLDMVRHPINRFNAW